MLPQKRAIRGTSVVCAFAPTDYRENIEYNNSECNRKFNVLRTAEDVGPYSFGLFLAVPLNLNCLYGVVNLQNCMEHAQTTLVRYYPPALQTT